jgi:hypothetical protein
MPPLSQVLSDAEVELNGWMTTAPELWSVATRRRTVAAWANAVGASQQALSRSGWIFVEREDFDSVVVVHIDQIGLAAAPTESPGRRLSSRDGSGAS